MHEVYSNCLQEGVASAEEESQGQAKHGTPAVPLQQETPGRDTDTLSVCPFKFQIMVFLNCSAVSFVLCCAMLCHAMRCYATVNLWALTRFTRMLPYTVVPPPPTHQRNLPQTLALSMSHTACSLACQRALFYVTMSYLAAFDWMSPCFWDWCCSNLVSKLVDLYLCVLITHNLDACVGDVDAKP